MQKYSPEILIDIICTYFWNECILSEWYFIRNRNDYAKIKLYFVYRVKKLEFSCSKTKQRLTIMPKIWFNSHSEKKGTTPQTDSFIRLKLKPKRNWNWFDKRLSAHFQKHRWQWWCRWVEAALFLMLLLHSIAVAGVSRCFLHVVLCRRCCYRTGRRSQWEQCGKRGWSMASFACWTNSLHKCFRDNASIPSAVVLVHRYTDFSAVFYFGGVINSFVVVIFISSRNASTVSIVHQIDFTVFDEHYWNALGFFQ